jgi:hypothetical protein
MNAHFCQILIRRKIRFNIDDLWEPKEKKYLPGRRRIMNSSTRCKHRPIHEIENKLYPDYDDGLYRRLYFELKEEIEDLIRNRVLSPARVPW